MEPQRFPAGRRWALPQERETVSWEACGPSMGWRPVLQHLGRCVPRSLQCKQVLPKGLGGGCDARGSGGRRGSLGVAEGKVHFGLAVVSQRGHSAYHTAGAQEIFIEQKNKREGKKGGSAGRRGRLN